MASRPPTQAPRNPRTTSASSHSAASAGVRRNLFQVRRPPVGPTQSTTASSTSTPATATLEAPSIGSSSGDIVSTDKNGNYDVEVPFLQVEKEDDVLEREKEDAHLAEAVRHYICDLNRTPNEPPELLAAVNASLRAKVASLQDDDWIYEGEEDGTLT